MAVEVTTLVVIGVQDNFFVKHRQQTDQMGYQLDSTTSIVTIVRQADGYGIPSKMNVDMKSVYTKG